MMDKKAKQTFYTAVQDRFPNVWAAVPFSNLLGKTVKYTGVFRPMFDDTDAGRQKAALLERSLLILGATWLGTKVLRSLQDESTDVLRDSERNPAKDTKKRLDMVVVDDLSGSGPSEDGRRVRKTAAQTPPPDQNPAAPSPQASQLAAAPGAPDKPSPAAPVSPPGAYYLPPQDYMGNAVETAVPALALLSGLYLFGRSDQKARVERMKEDLATMKTKKQALVNRLIQARARLAKGNIDDKEIDALLAEAGWDPDQALAKTAAANASDPPVVPPPARPEDNGSHPGWTTFLSFPALLLIAAFGIGTVAGYNYFSYNDMDNIKYRAAKKGLKTYARSKTMKAPISIYNSAGDSYFDEIDGPGESMLAAGDDPRSEVEKQPAKIPLTISL